MPIYSIQYNAVHAPENQPFNKILDILFSIWAALSGNVGGLITHSINSQQLIEIEMLM